MHAVWKSMQKGGEGMSRRPYAGTQARFALYHGDDFVDMGTAAEIAERRGVKPATIAYYATPSNMRRVDGRVNKHKSSYVAVRL